LDDVIESDGPFLIFDLKRSWLKLLHKSSQKLFFLGRRRLEQIS